jgi:polysaccharide biosynthesis protein PslG
VPIRRALAFAAAVIAALALAPAAGAAPVGRDFIGITAEDVFAGDADYRARNLDAQSALEIGLLRQTFDWAQIERAPGQYDLSYHDGFVLAAAQHGITVLPILFHTPGFHAGRVSDRAACPPRTNASLAAYAQTLVRRYGPDGTLWAERPDVPRLPIRSWQIWNEPNLPVYWCGKPNAKQYVGMLRTVGTAIKQVDRRANVVTAGLPDSKLTGAVPLKRFIDQLYAAKAAKYFDSLAINSYAKDHLQLGRILGSVRKQMNARRDRRGEIWITEIGWGDRGPKHRYIVGEKGQATRIAKSLALIRKQRSRLRLRGVVYFSWRDGAPYAPNFKDMWGLHTGLLDINGEPKQGFDVFKQRSKSFR